MKRVIILTILFYLNVVIAQLVYPDDETLVKIFDTRQPFKVVQTNTRGTAQNEHVNNLITKGVTNLALSISNFNINNPRERNVVFSPVSIVNALALLLLGSNGKTFQELANVMGLTAGVDISSQTQTVHEHLGDLLSKLEQNSRNFNGIVRVAAAIFVEDFYPIRSLYKSTSELLYKTEVRSLQFSKSPERAQSTINNWVKQKTNGKIKDIVEDVPATDTKIIIVSALYFNGPWEMPFFAGHTKRRKFYMQGRKSPTNMEVEMMSNGGDFPYFKDPSLNCEIMGFPYKGNDTTFYVIIPFGSNDRILKDFQKRLTSADVENLVSKTKYTRSVILFPKMVLENSMDLKPTLQQLGVKDLFSFQKANLALISSGYPELKPSQSAQKTQEEFLIFSRFGGDEEPVETHSNCSLIFATNSTITQCKELDKTTQKEVIYKKFGDKVGRRVTRQSNVDSLDKLRSILNSNPGNMNSENPGLYVDKILHKTYVEVTESGTEAAAATSSSLFRGGDIVTFRVDVPFIFFIRNEKTKLILFWGTVFEPTPNFRI